MTPSSSPTPPTEIYREAELRWLVVARLLVLFFAMVFATISSYSVLWSTAAFNIVFSSLGFLFAFCAASAWWLRNRKPGPVFTVLQLLGDVFVITGVIYITGGPHSPFLFLYLPVVMLVSILFRRSIALFVVAACSIEYAVLAYGLATGWIPSVFGDDVGAPPHGGYFLQFVGLSSGMFLTALATGFLAKKLHFSVEESQRSISELGKQQKLLIDQLGEGILSCDLAGNVTSINQAASHMLQVREEVGTGKPISEVCPQISFHAVKAKQGLEQELELHVDGEVLNLSYQSRAIITDSGEETGYLVLLRDVTKLKNAEEQIQLHDRMARLRAEDETSLERGTQRESFHHFIGESVVMHKVFKLIERVAPSDATALIYGESGTGKELVAKAVHELGPRAAKPFVAVNCGAIPETLIESELFGHKKGAFTGADNETQGMFRAADGGTLFLDEIGELPLHMQAKLLRAIQEKKVRPVGGERDIPIDVRIVAASNRNLRREVERAAFREDLFFRLNVININLPPLRDRKDDIPLLVHGILRRLSGGGTMPVVAPATMQFLMRYAYPGNVRELENMLERAMVLGGGVILPDHLPDYVRDVQEGTAQVPAKLAHTEIIVDESMDFPVNLEDILSGIERRYIEVALLKSAGGKKKAAELLGINFRSFRYRLAKFHID